MILAKPNGVLIARWQRITHHLLLALDDELADLRLSAAETNVLAGLAETGEPRVRELVAATAQRPSTLTGVLDRLERRGLVERRPNRADHRSTIIVLTEPGGAAADRVEEAFERVASRIPRGVAADVDRVLQALERSFGGHPAG
jgi:MarR family transcriptional regulator, organic hydroperoxide resistance regulator